MEAPRGKDWRTMEMKPPINRHFRMGYISLSLLWFLTPERLIRQLVDNYIGEVMKIEVELTETMEANEEQKELYCQKTACMKKGANEIGIMICGVEHFMVLCDDCAIDLMTIIEEGCQE